ncbi:hypothetical protein F8M41_024698 [Gigaspora margarita]|uniref:Uncharacterized protein n=1 Tax=Gigaspora margarita TaxID=4874 RepID=A0A8H3XJV8_GIGMA|nr:hypothetical protein F8M41_024698 [Gigaspora margarita]
MSSELPTIIKGAIEEFFDKNPNWTLLEFLNYRAEASDFTYDKGSEHKLYREALKILSKDHIKAHASFLKFENEKSSKGVEVFWSEVKKLVYEKQISVIRADGILNIFKATNKSQQHVMNIQHQDLSDLYSNVQNVPTIVLNTNQNMYTTPCPIRHQSEDYPKGEPRPKRLAVAKTDGKFFVPLGTYNNTNKNDDDEYEESDDESEDELTLNTEKLAFDDYIGQNEKPFIFKDKNTSLLFKSYRSDVLALVKESSLSITKNYREILKDIKSNILGKERLSRLSKDIKSILREYIEIALDEEEGGLDTLRKLIIESYSKEFDIAEEHELFLKMQLLFQQLADNIPIHLSKEKISEGTLVANIISPILRVFFHDASIHPTTWPNTSSSSAKVRKLANDDPTRAKQPDMIGNILNNGKFVHEMMYGEVTGEGKNNTEKKNLLDLIRLGIFMKESIDNILQNTCVNSTVFAWQSIVTKWTGYFMTLIAPGIYLMVEVGSVELPRSFETCSTFLNGLDLLRTFQTAYEQTSKRVLKVINENKEEHENPKDVEFITWRRPTLGTPVFKKITKTTGSRYCNNLNISNRS